MKKAIVIMMAFAVVQLLAGCAANKVQTAKMNVPDNRLLLTYGPLWGTLYQQKAAEYKALTIQAYNIAREKLDAYLQQQSNKPIAVITDIDETILDNSPNAVHDALLGKTYSDSSWIAWSKRVEADTVPGAPAFFKYAASKNVAVFYISNRLTQELTQTIANLQKYNMPYADAAHVLLKTTTSNKDERRASVTANYNVVLYFGDNLGDFTGVFDKQSTEIRDSLVHQHAAGFGNRFIVLPNPVYGEWVSALYHYRYADSMNVKADTMIKALTTY
ncbi:5'-nucleotidase, lipoprotein e(P4) family [Ilyomonas limi]|uniref:5'-nucleotidase, lipoprotein e(P4) family n=1 Tax=Ilyomonas limi TaxID=2575867 RepID=A0A4U3L937_9BACT|nr:5'-nucleotidase, lipoprotein e(P4) family [Ilyomonas limi]TKK70984.1 5'-nucleotidase, lipoprotein e(P4) family [Ilyomonas limi]